MSHWLRFLWLLFLLNFVLPFKPQGSFLRPLSKLRSDYRCGGGGYADTTEKWTTVTTAPLRSGPEKQQQWLWKVLPLVRTGFQIYFIFFLSATFLEKAPFVGLKKHLILPCSIPQSIAPEQKTDCMSSHNNGLKLTEFPELMSSPSSYWSSWPEEMALSKLCCGAFAGPE